MLVKGFIDTVGAVLTGNKSNTHTTYIQVLGGGYIINVGRIEFSKPYYLSSVHKLTGRTENASDYAFSPFNKSIVLGTSDTTPTSSDADIIDAEFCPSGTVNISENKVIVTGTYTNTATESKTFKEIGLIGATNYVNGSLTGNLGVLYSRSVFPEPVVIPAGESKSFTITIDFNKFADTVVTA